MITRGGRKQFSNTILYVSGYLSFWVINKDLKTIDEVGSVEGISTNTYTQGLPQANLNQKQ